MSQVSGTSNPIGVKDYLYMRTISVTQ